MLLLETRNTLQKLAARPASQRIVPRSAIQAMGGRDAAGPIDGLAAKAELKEIIAEASRALAVLDERRLQELALCCAALNRDLDSTDADARYDLARQARAAASDMRVFARVLEATRANRNVMRRLRELRTARLEYSERQARGGVFEAVRETHGND